MGMQRTLANGVPPASPGVCIVLLLAGVLPCASPSLVHGVARQRWQPVGEAWCGSTELQVAPMTGTGGAVACIDKVSGALTGLVTLSGATHSRFNLNGSRQVELEDCTLDAAPHVSPAGAANNTVTVRTVWRCSPNFYHDVPNATAVVVETFRPSSSAIGGVDWDMTITSPSVSPWSTAVHSHLSFSGGHAAAGGSSSEGGKMWVGGPRKASLPTATYDPLAPFNASELGGYTKFYYGGTMNDINDPHQTPSAPAQQLPVMVRINAFDNASVGVLQSPRDTPVVAYTEVSPGAATGRNQGVDMSFVRQYQRFCNTCTPATFRQHILAGGGGWRTIVAQYQSIYPSFFHPAVNTSMVDGPGSYADLRGPPDINASAAERYRGYGYTFNWDSTARFPCHGEWIPTAQDGYNETWLTCFAHAAPDHHTNEPCSTTSFTEIASWYEHQRSLGFATCAYGNLFEYGWNVSGVWPPGRQDCSPAAAAASNHSVLGCHTQRLLADKYHPALVYAARDPGHLVCGGLDGSCIMDPHPDLPYLQHLLDMAHTSIGRTPSAGVCIDRQDWIGQVNPAADDGNTWFPVRPGKQFAPVRAMIFSWKSAMAAFAAVWHNSSKAVFINDHSNRLDMMEHVDGIYSEMADVTADGWSHGLGAALVAMNKPVVMWDHPKSQDTPQAVFAEALKASLYVGAYPTVPIYNNDHAVGGDCAPSCKYDTVFAQYGPLFRLLKGKRWLLTERPAAVSEGPAGALANAFTVDRGTLVVVILPQAPAASTHNVTVTLNVPGPVAAVSAFWPGGASAPVVHTPGDPRVSSELRGGTVLLMLQ